MKPSVDDLNAALLKVMQKNGRRLLAEIGRDEGRMALEHTNQSLAIREYNDLLNTADMDTLCSHRRGISELRADHEVTV